MLNKQIYVDQHPLPKLDELMEKLHGDQQFTKIDLADAYLQIELMNKLSYSASSIHFWGFFVITICVLVLHAVPLSFKDAWTQ